MDFLTSSAAVWTPHFTNFLSRRKKNYYDLDPFTTRYLYTPSTPVFYQQGRLNSDQKRYFSNDLPFFTNQGRNRKSIVPSILEYNVRHATEAQERETEWNTVGLSSGKNPLQWRKFKQEGIISSMAVAIRASTSKKSNAQQNIDEFLKSFASKEDENMFNRTKKFAKETLKDVQPQETEEQIRQRREKEREESDRKLEEVEGKLQHVEQDMQVANTEILQLKATLQKEVEKTEELGKKFTELKATMELIKNAAENMQKLQDNIESQKEKLLGWQGKWEEIRVPLIEDYRELKLKYSRREEEIVLRREEIKNMRAEIKTLVAASTKKDERYKQLLEILKGMKDQERRDIYTNKILVLVDTVKKYRTEINTILIDNKIVQKEINVLLDTLKRTFTDVEDLIFKEVKKKEKSTTDSYKRLARIDEIFKELTDVYSKTGTTTNQALQLGEKINKLEARTTSLNMERINEDLKQVREENQRLQEKYKKAISKTTKA
eukprot:TRINITY_DN6922_c0_g2_i4.p1 TRINITY_DN6922_c0_g2~~TRINITY_DN6922_c0_g2_i4.p1  ORF type:complete len:491 (-),score=138.30 TRINITY_DN6922_c0_g2_i4:250-1722(-)